MKVNIYCICLCAMLFCGAASKARDGTDDFFQKRQDIGEKLPADKNYPQGRIFPFAGYSPRYYFKAAQSGFTLLGPTYGSVDSLAQKAAEVNLPVIYPIRVACGEHKITLNTLSDRKIELDFEVIKKDLESQVEQAIQSHDNIAWWYVIPEELRYWRTREYEYLRLAYDTIRQADPEKRPVWMYIAGHYSGKALAKYTDRVDWLAKGMYVNYSGYRDQRIWVRHSMEITCQALAETKSSALPLAVPEMFQTPPKEFLPNIPAWVRHDVYLALIGGAKGVVIFSLAPRNGFYEAWELYFSTYGQVAQELRGPNGLGEVFLFGERRQEIKLEHLAGAKELQLKVGSEEYTYPSVAFADILHKSGRWLVVANSDNNKVSCKFRGLPPKQQVTIKDGITKQIFLETVKDDFLVDLEPLEVKILKICKQE